MSNRKDATKKSKETNSKIGRKLATLAGTGAVAAMVSGMPSVSGADIVQSNSAPIAPPSSNGTVGWDVDSDGTTDFDLTRFISRYTSSSGFMSYFNFVSIKDAPGGRLVAPQWLGVGGISKLPESANVGQTLDAAYKFHAGQQFNNSISTVGAIGRGARYGTWRIGDTGFFGFKFTSSGNTHYGWGEMTIHGNQQGFTINKAYYNDTPDASIRVGATSSIPEPSGMGTLCLLAAGLFASRRRK